MLTIRTYKKLEGLVLMHGLNVESIFEFNERYSIWLSDGTNIEIDREPHWKSSTVTYYKMYIGGGTPAMTEFIMIETINTLDRMVKHLIYIHEKYINK
jgi:hypothetical protein